MKTGYLLKLGDEYVGPNSVQPSRRWPFKKFESLQEAAQFRLTCETRWAEAGIVRVKWEEVVI